MIDCHFLVKPGHAPKLSKRDTDDTGGFSDDHDGKKLAKQQSKEHLKKLYDQQEVLYAGQKHAVLIVLQALDAGGKDSTIKHIFGGMNPQGCAVTSFKVPTELERRHDFLWRHHLAMPPKGMFGIHNRSHYESVLVERVHGLVDKGVWERRYEQINHFESMLASEGTTILKFFLHISKGEQKERFEDRLHEADKHWKFNPADLAERKLWDDYQKAFEEALEKTSTACAPWYVIPADKKWVRNWVVSDVVLKTVQGLDLEYPPAVEGIEKYEVD